MYKYNHVENKMVLIQLMCPSASWRSMGWHGSSAAWYFDECAPRMDMMEALSRAKLSLHLIQWIVYCIHAVLLFSLIMAASLYSHFSPSLPPVVVT